MQVRRGYDDPLFPSLVLVGNCCKNVRCKISLKLWRCDVLTKRCFWLCVFILSFNFYSNMNLLEISFYFPTLHERTDAIMYSVVQVFFMLCGQQQRKIARNCCNLVRVLYLLTSLLTLYNCV